MGRQIIVLSAILFWGVFCWAETVAVYDGDAMAIETGDATTDADASIGFVLSDLESMASVLTCGAGVIPDIGEPDGENCDLSRRGFLVKVVKAPEGTDLLGDYDHAYEMAEWLVDNETLGPNIPATEVGSRFVEVVNLHDSGNRLMFTWAEETFPGIDAFSADPCDPADGDDDNDFAILVTGCIELTEGLHILGGACDNGVKIEIGGVEIGRTNAWNEVGQYLVEAPESGLYSYRAVAFEQDGPASLEILEWVPDGSMFLLNAPSAPSKGGSVVYAPRMSDPVCPATDFSGDCLVNFLDFGIIASKANFFDIYYVASQWLESVEEDAEPLTILGRLKTGGGQADSFAVQCVVVDKRRIRRSQFKYECRVILENLSTTAFEDIELGMVSWSDNVTMMDTRVSFGDMRIEPGQSATSLDTCTFLVDRSVPINPVETIWHMIFIPEEMAFIPGGTFQMGDNFNFGDADELPVHTVTVDPFFMGRHEVTNQQYCDYLNSAYNASLIKVVEDRVYASSDGGNIYHYCDTYRSDDDARIRYLHGVFTVLPKLGRDMSNDPVVEVSWCGAAAYCNWRSLQEGYDNCYNLSSWRCSLSKKGYRLATEAEWEFAARGGTTDKRFHWGDTISHINANYSARPSYYPYDVNPTSGCHPTWSDGAAPCTSPWGSFAANGYGLYDMSGNVWEWCNDAYASDYYDYSPTDNPAGPLMSPEYFVVRGGSWNWTPHTCRVANRSYALMVDCSSEVGFRIVLPSEVPEPPPVEYEYVDLDDMESYVSWDMPGDHVFEIWRDGLGNCMPGNGNDTGATLTEYYDPVLSGIQSMRYDYDNDGLVYNPCWLMETRRKYLYSKIVAQVGDLPSGVGADWNLWETTRLVINFHGRRGNVLEDIDRLWVELKDADGNSAKAVYGDRPGEAPQHLTEASWHEWFIELGDFAEDGVDTTDLQSIAIGVGSEEAETPGGSGTLYFDDIRLATFE